MAAQRPISETLLVLVGTLLIIGALLQGVDSVPQRRGRGELSQGGPQQQQQKAQQKAPQAQGASGKIGANEVADVLNRYGYEDIGGGKYAVIINGFNTWVGAYDACRAHLPGASLFFVSNAQDSEWLGRRINHEKNRVTGASKFWVGLVSHGSQGPLQWLDGRNYHHYPEVVQVSGHDDSSKLFAWAVPDGLITKLKYEFLTAEDEAEAYICQYVPVILLTKYHDR